MRQLEEVSPEPARPTLATVLAQLTARLANTLGCSEGEITPGKALEEYGLGSLDGLMLLGDLELWLGIHIPPTAIADHPTLEEFAAYLFRLASGRDD